MATTRWTGQAIAVAQIDTVQVTAYDAATTYKLTVGGIDIVSEAGDTDVNTTASNISSAWNNSAHPYATGITASVATDTVTLTSDTAGEPFTVSSSATGGTGTIGSVTNTTANDGPNVWDSANNWDNGVPANTDDVVIDAGAIDIRWGLDQSGISGTYNSLAIKAGYTGKIGLNRNAVYTAGAETTAAPEYREDYLKVKTAVIDIGENDTGQSVNGSRRIKLDAGSTSAVVRVHSTPNSGNPTGNQPLMLLANNSGTDVYVYSGQVGVAIDEGETSTIEKVVVAAGTVRTGDGLTITTFDSNGGSSHKLQAAGTVTTLNCRGGDVTTDGSFAITTANVDGGVFNSNSTGTITTLNVNGGTASFIGNDQTRTVTTTTLKAGSTLRANQDYVTYTNAFALSGDKSVTISTS